tara:strand:+ start:230 stop:418 length:189 start_codon:yes stop_codon:yes gene_type:complete
MKIKIEFDTDNDSFQEGFYTEVKKVMSNVENIIECHGILIEIDSPVYDTNGNKIGKVTKEVV